MGQIKNIKLHIVTDIKRKHVFPYHPDIVSSPDPSASCRTTPEELWMCTSHESVPSPTTSSQPRTMLLCRYPLLRLMKREEWPVASNPLPSVEKFEPWEKLTTPSPTYVPRMEFWPLITTYELYVNLNYMMN